MYKLSFLFSIICFFSQAQQEFGLEITKELCSEKYDVRGYVNDGHLKAAEFVKSKFVEYGLKPIGDNYFHPFNISVNTLPGEATIALDGQKLEIGRDFIYDANSGPAKGVFTPVFIISAKEFFNF